MSHDVSLPFAAVQKPSKHNVTTSSCIIRDLYTIHGFLRIRKEDWIHDRLNKSILDEVNNFCRYPSTDVSWCETPKRKHIKKKENSVGTGNIFHKCNSIEHENYCTATENIYNK